MGKELKITLASARVNAGLTQWQASIKLGISKRTLSNWERGVTTPPVDKALLICELYGVNYDNIIFLPNGTRKVE